ncbi:hypothetical protein [Novosphingobium colocasiae]|uniref:Uncharacterized protein n=1 Tax=Novosphingobium colocasiae TaxID=1256513 RepID=A0A918PBF0_9SPHN|nr:hypothetical protein [Novosphingobium colocasiae]GGY96584.1 hypothetical protein GCM10011614_09290 [Novosphingobium colocasiae]
MERILFGDNQFFGINHLSEEKARNQAMRFQNIDSVIDVLQEALKAGVGGFMCTTHDTIEKIADRVRADAGAWEGFTFYPGMPYAHKYANAVTELGYFDALRKFLPKDGLVDTMLRGGMALLNRDIEGMMTLLVDAEMQMFEGLKTPVIFLQNVVTDLIQGLGIIDAFRIFADHCQTRYGARAGFITMNLPRLLPLLHQAGIENPIVCANVNKIAFRMAGGIESYREATARYPARVIAMSVLASGGIRPREAIEWVVNEPYVESILFGASSRSNIIDTVNLIREFDGRKQVAA